MSQWLFARFASIATTTHCEPNTSASSPIRSGRWSAAELIDTLSAPASSTAWASAAERMPPPMTNGMNTLSAVRRASSTIVSRRSWDAVMSRNTTSSAPSPSYRAASSTGSPASRRPTKLVPLTTRPASTSRHGITRLRCTASAYERGLGLTDREALLVQRLAHDHPAEVDLPQLGERLEVVELADPPAVEKPSAHDRRDALDLGEVGPLEHAVLVDVRVDERAHTALLEPADDRVGGHLGRLGPTRGGDVAAARVDRDHEAIAERAEDVVE